MARRRKRSTFRRRGGKPYGATAGADLESVPAFDPPPLPDACAELRARGGIFAGLSDIVIAGSAPLRELAFEIQAGMPREVAAVVVGFDGGAEPSRTTFAAMEIDGNGRVIVRFLSDSKDPA